MRQWLVHFRVARSTALLALVLLIATTTACGSDGHHGAPTPSVTATPMPTTAAVAAAPIRTVRTTDGTVAYRSVGTGPTLVLIMGFGGTQDNWTPGFVSALARNHRVITFDNAGVGKTSALPAPLTVTAMARQTAALLTALHTGRVAVLGWSMGGTVAQALAVLHPTLVSRLVLAATYAGTGAATPPTAETVRQLTASVTNPAAALPLLFPTEAVVGEQQYLAGILSWAQSDPAAPAAVAAQAPALTSWQQGTEAAGRRNSAIAVPTLVADAAQDLLTPPANAATLAALIPGAQKVVYPGAGHAFLFQLQDEFLTRVAAFVG